MKNTFLLSKGLINPKVDRWVILVIALINITGGIRDFTRPPVSTLDIFIDSLLIGSGILMIILFLTVYNPISRLSPKIIIDDNQILIKERLGRPIDSISWKDIKQINYASYELTFLMLDNSSKTVEINTSPITTVSIKKALREMADKRSIKVIGG